MTQVTSKEIRELIIKIDSQISESMKDTDSEIQLDPQDYIESAFIKFLKDKGVKVVD